MKKSEIIKEFIIKHLPRSKRNLDVALVESLLTQWSSKPSSDIYAQLSHYVKHMDMVELCINGGQMTSKQHAYAANYKRRIATLNKYAKLISECNED